MGDVPTFKINGKVYEIGDNVTSDDRLVNFLHDHQLNGTHITCYEGGCGACVVTASVPNAVTGTMETYSVNSCLVPVANCAGWEITTVEGLGNSQEGYHVIQERLAEYSGTQCGYCSPGFVMSMYGLTQNNPSWTDEDVEKMMDANFCRCTGYRPIVDAFKSITPEDMKDAKPNGCKKAGQCCKGKCSKSKSSGGGGAKGKTFNANYFMPETLEELYAILAGLPAGDRYTLISGYTGQAVVGMDYSSKASIFIRKIPELSQMSQTTDSIIFGANVTISRMMTEMKTKSADVGFGYLDQLAKCWEKLAGTSVRNMGSWAGNLAMKTDHKEFPSDLFTHLVAAGATVTLASSDGSTSTHDVEELLTMDLVGDRKIIRDLTLPSMGENVVFRAFKVNPRSTNSHAHVNAGFRMEVDFTNVHTVVGKPTIVYGCINATFVHASATEVALTDKSLEDETAIQAAMAALASEVVPDTSPVEPDPAFKVALTQNLLYKAILGIVGDTASPDLISGANNLKRPLATGQQTYDQNTEFWPLAQPIPKLEAYIQCSGEAEYAVLTAPIPGELFGLFVTSTQANAAIVSIDASAALEIPGVVAFVGVEDIGGVNSIRNQASPIIPDVIEQLFPVDRVSYYGQPLGLIVSEGRGPAYAGVAAVKVTYDDIQPPILTIEEALKNPLPPGQPDPFIQGDVDAGFATSTTIVEGAMARGGQYHYGMESQVCIATPTDEGLDIIAGTQWASETQRSIGQVLGIQDNKVNVTVKRVGGAFGSKISRCNIIATATALAAQKTRKRVRTPLDFGVNTTLVGWREPFLCNYKVGVDDEGLLQAVEATLTSDPGYIGADVAAAMAAFDMPSCYTCPNWKATGQYVLTNTAANTWTRSPGSVEGISFMENIMDHVANAIGMDPLELRRKNLLQDGSIRYMNGGRYRLLSAMAGKTVPNVPLPVKIENNLISDMIDQIMESAEVTTRKTDIDTFNQNNQWKKRGLAVMPELYSYNPGSFVPFNAMVSTNVRDGTVTVSHGGSELGQGLNTKVAQCAAYELGIDLSMIAIKATNTHVNANTTQTAGSHGSDVTAFCASIACRNLKARLETFKKTLENPNVDWKDLVEQAYFNGIDICERYANKLDEINAYPIFGVTATEVELDVLTGEYLVLRTDLLEDAGRAMSPLIDIGQCEGGFVMGQGLFTTEKPAYDPATGERLTNTTWLYKPPMSDDIPADFRVTLLQNAPNPLGVQSSKVTGEPPLIMSFSIIMALRQAIASARSDGGTTGWFQIDAPLTVEERQLLCLVDPSRLVIKDA